MTLHSMKRTYFLKNQSSMTPYDHNEWGCILVNIYHMGITQLLFDYGCFETTIELSFSMLVVKKNSNEALLYQLRLIKILHFTKKKNRSGLLLLLSIPGCLIFFVLFSDHANTEIMVYKKHKAVIN